MWRIWMLIAENLDLLLTVAGASAAYFLNRDQQKAFLLRFQPLNKKLEQWREFRKRHKTFDLYLTLILTLVSAAAFVPLVLERWPDITAWAEATHNKHPSLLGWTLFVFALCAAFGLFELRKYALKIYAYIEIVVGVGLVAITSFDAGQAKMAIGVKMAGAIYAMIRGLVNLTDAKRKEANKRPPLN